MKKAIIYTAMSLFAMVLSSCKKEIVQPVNEEVISETKTIRSATVSDDSAGAPITDPIDPTITDPNDDDYSNRKNVKNKK